MADMRCVKVKVMFQHNRDQGEKNLVFRSDPLTPVDDHLIRGEGWGEAEQAGSIVLAGPADLIDLFLDCEFRKVLSVL